MHEISFRYGRTGELFEALCESAQPVLEVSWPGLLAAGSGEDAHEWSAYGPNGDEHAVWLGLAWRLAAGQELTVVTTLADPAAAQVNGRPGVRVRWSYSVDTKRPLPVRDAGFARGRNLVAFAADDWHDLVQVQMAHRGEALTEVTLFALGPDRRLDLLSALNGRRPPELGTFLNDGEMLIDVVVGDDPGYASCIIGKSRDDLRSRCEPVSSAMNDAVKRYEQASSTVDGINQFNERVTEMAVGPL